MAEIIWRETFNLGITKIDEQHKKLIEIINELYNAHRRGTGQAIMSEILDELVDYTNYHFSMEEDLFTQFDYPAKEAHKSEHSYFVEKISNLQLESKKGNLLLSLKTVDFLKDWTINHILGTDIEFANFLKEKEVG